MAETIVEQPAAGERRIKISYEEFLALPEEVHAEWVDGEMIIFMPLGDFYEHHPTAA